MIYVDTYYVYSDVMSSDNDYNVFFNFFEFFLNLIFLMFFEM